MNSAEPRAHLVAAGVSLALVGLGMGVVGGAGAGQPWSLVGWATFVVGWAIAAVGAVKSGFRFGRGR